MKNIHQTPFGAFLCWLGIHLPVVGGWNDRDGYSSGAAGHPQSVWGGCIRCNAGWQWDN